MRRNKFNAVGIEVEASQMGSCALWAWGPGPHRLTVHGGACFSSFSYADKETRSILVIPMTPNHESIGKEYAEALKAWMGWLCTDFPLAHVCHEDGATEDHCYQVNVEADTWEVHHWCTTARIPYEHTGPFKAWWKLVNDHGVPPNEAYLMCLTLTENLLPVRNYIGHSAISECVCKEIVYNFMNKKWSTKGTRWIDEPRYRGHGSMFGVGGTESLYDVILSAQNEAKAESSGVSVEVIEDPFGALTVDGAEVGVGWIEPVLATINKWSEL